MEILELYLKHYGKFTDYRLKLHTGVNVICGANETGKSTLHSFIRAMLYGISKKGRGMDEYQLRQPWDNPDFFQGAMRVFHRQKIYRIERNFLKKDESVSIVCETDGKAVENPEEMLSEFAGNLSEESFDNTFFIRQAGARTSAALYTDIRNYLVNMERSGGVEIDVKGALDLLRKRKKEALLRKEEVLKDLKRESDENRSEADFLREETDRLKGQLSDSSLKGQKSPLSLDEELEDAGEKVPDAEGSAQDFFQGEESPLRAEGPVRDENEKSSLTLISLLFLAGVLSGACAFFSADRTMQIALLLLCLLLLLITIILILRMPRSGVPDRAERREQRERFLDRHLGFRDDPDDREQEEALTEKRQEQERGAHARMEGQRQAILREIREKENRLRELDQAFEALGSGREDLKLIEQECAAIDLASARIETLSGQLYEEQGELLAARVSNLLSALTGGKYDNIAIDQKMEVNVNTPDHLLKVAQVSYGTMEQIYFSLRLCAGELLSSGTVPVILDEPFAMYDDDRLREVLLYLRTCGRQVILFTCQRRELELLNEIEAT